MLGQRIKGVLTHFGRISASVRSSLWETGDFALLKASVI